MNNRANNTQERKDCEIDILSIRVVINGYTLRLNINRDDEEIYRRAASELNQRMQAYHDRFSQKESHGEPIAISETQILTMVAFEAAVEVQRQAANQHTKPISQINDLKAMLEKARNAIGNEDEDEY